MAWLVLIHHQTQAGKKTLKRVLILGLQYSGIPQGRLN
jgi:hypothetical protein